MLLLKDFSPYQKIDFSITDNIETKITAGFGPFISIYQNHSLSAQVNSKLAIIEENKVKKQLNGFLFSVPRFTKCLFRKDTDMYRHWKHISDKAIILLYEKYSGWEEKKKVSVKELSELNKILGNDEKELLHEIFPPAGVVNIAESYQVCFELIITLCRQKAEYFKVELNEAFIRYIEGFLKAKIRRANLLRYPKICS